MQTENKYKAPENADGSLTMFTRPLDLDNLLKELDTK